MAALWLRSVRRRPGTAFGLTFVVAVAIAAATAGPMLVRAAEQSGLRADLARAQPGEYDLTVSADTRDNLVTDVIDTARVAATAAARQLFDAPVVVVRSQQRHEWRLTPRGARRAARVASIDSGCALLRVTAGRCPSRRGELLVADGTKVAVGRKISFESGGVFTVTGRYAPASLPRWLSDLGSAPMLGLEQTVELVDPQPKVIARDRLRATAVNLDSLAVAGRSLRAVRSVLLGQPIVAAGDTRLSALATSVHRNQQVTTVVGLIAVIPLVVLCWYALVLMMQLVALVRSREWALGRLRGLPLRNWLASLYAEPGALLLAGVVGGFGVGLAVAELTVHATMSAGTPVEPVRPPVLISVGGAIVGAAVGVGTATLRGARLPLAALLQQSAEPKRLSRAAAAMHVLVVAAAVLSVVQLATHNQVDVNAGNVGLLLPGLLAAVAGLALIRVAAHAAGRRTGTAPRSVRALLLGRRLARNPALLARYLVVAVATSVAVFTVSLIVIIHRNVQIRAGNQLGAATVVDVRAVSPTGLVSAVAKADPSGRYAMAVEQLRGSTTGGTARVVAVDTSRLAAVSGWRASWAGLSASEVKRRLDPPHVPSVVLRGTRLSVVVADVSSATAPFDVAPLSPAPRPVLQVVLLTDNRWTPVPLGRLVPHDGLQTLSAAMPCRTGCVLRSVEFSNDSSTLFSGSATITAVSTDSQPPSRFAAALRSSRSWQTILANAAPGLPVEATAQGTPDGLRVHFRDHTGMSTAGLQPADGPAILPAVLADGTDAEPLPALLHAVDGTGLDATSIPVAVVARATALPSSVDDGAMVDLAAAARLSDPAESKASPQVWLSASAPAAIVRALHRAGLTVTGIARSRAVADHLLAAAPVRALTASGASVALLALLAATALGAGAAIDIERRRAHLRVLRDSGLAPKLIRRLSTEDVALPTTLAIAVGVLTGVVSLLVAGPRLPLFADTAGPPLDTSPAWLLSAGAGAGLIVVAVAAAAAAARAEFRSATRPARS